MLEDCHIFTIKTKDAANVAGIKAGGAGIVISGLNVLRDQIRVGDFVFVVFGGDKPKGWKPGLVGLAHISKTPFDEGYDGGKNFRVAIDVDVYFEPSIIRGDLVTYPDTFDTIGIGPITKWEPNQAITSVPRRNAIALLHAICDLRPDVLDDIKALLGADFSVVEQPVARYAIAKSRLGENVVSPLSLEEKRRNEFFDWMLRVEKKSPKTAKDTSSIYLPSISDDLAPRTASVWHGLREYLYNEKPTKKIYSVDSLAELDELYGGLDRIFRQDGEAGELDPQRFKECKDWVDSPANHNSVRAAWGMYKRFMEWHESRQKKKDVPQLVPPAVDCLSIALKIFAEKRYEGDWQEKTCGDGYQCIFAMPGMTPEELAAGSLDDFYENFLLKIWAFKNGGIRRYGQLDDAGKAAYRDFVVGMKKELKSFDAYFPPNTQCPDGMGVGVLSELLMRFWPKSCCSYNKQLIHDALVVLGMAEGDFGWPKTPSIYQDFMGKCASILLRIEQMKLARRPNPDNDEPPDYFTVNEFLWFVHDYKDLIKEEVMKKQLKPVNSKEKIKKGARKLEDAFKDDEMLKRLAAALRTKPFAILAGHSGTGKSRLVRRLAYMTCNNELLIAEGAGKAAPGNYCMVQVKPNWHDSTDLLGYYSEMDGRHFVNTPFVQFICKAYAYPDTPFFVCLDEMNLAPVEQYFAEYLSAVESMEEKDGVWVTDSLVEIDKTGEKDADGREKMDVAILEQIMKGAASTEAAEWIQKHGLTIPKNLFVVGTVNVDETTSQFPRKVLDRAMTLLMNEVRFADMAKSKSPSEEELLDETGLKFFLERDDRKVGERESKLLDGINAPLSNTPFMVAYRFGNEYALYEAALAKLDGVDLASADEPKQDEIARRALDHVVMMKLLPRIHGEKVEVKNIFGGYDRKKEGGAAEHVDGLKNKLPSDGLSVSMMDKILARDDEYLTFWP